MKSIRPLKRSVSPFGSVALPEDDSFGTLRNLVSQSTFKEAHPLPGLLEKIANAPANDAPQLDELCQFLLRYRETLKAHHLDEAFFEAMMILFERKTELFMIVSTEADPDQPHATAKDMVLFSKERDALAGRFFAPFTESQPGLFSEFVKRWMETENPDRILHFLDFCSGAKNPTFEHYLLFTHPALARIISNKSQLRVLFDKAQPTLSKLSSPTWEKETRANLQI